MTKSFGWITPAAMLALIYAVMRKLRKFAFPATWFLFLVLMFNFGSSSLTSYRPLVVIVRYLYPILFPAVLLAGGLLGALFGTQSEKKGELWRERFFWGCVISLAILYICTARTSKNIKLSPRSKMGRTAALELTPQDVIYTDFRTARVLRFFWGYPHQDRIKELSGMGVSDISPSSYVLVNRMRIDLMNKNQGYLPPKFYDQIPNNWRETLSIEKATLYWIPSEDQQ